MSSEEKRNTPHCISYLFLTAVKSVSQPTRGLRRATHASAWLFQTRRRNVPWNRSSELFSRHPCRSITLHNHQSRCCQPRNALCHILQSSNWTEIKSVHHSYARKTTAEPWAEVMPPKLQLSSFFKSVPCRYICKFLPLSCPKFPLLPFPRTVKLFIITLFKCTTKKLLKALTDVSIRMSLARLTRNPLRFLPLAAWCPHGYKLRKTPCLMHWAPFSQSNL